MEYVTLKVDIINIILLKDGTDNPLDISHVSWVVISSSHFKSDRYASFSLQYHPYIEKKETHFLQTVPLMIGLCKLCEIIFC